MSKTARWDGCGCGRPNFFSQGYCCYSLHGFDIHRCADDHVPATFIGPSSRANEFIHLKYMRSRGNIEHHAPLDHVLWGGGWAKA